MSIVFWAPDCCYRGGARHNFEPRITVNIVPPDPRDLSPAQLVFLHQLTRTTRTYHGDVCTWCGKIVKP